MLQNAYLDAKIGVDPAENELRMASAASWLSAGEYPRDAGHDTSLFRRLVLGWIEADFRVQIRILQHFSKSTRKSSSREQISQNFCQKFAKFCNFLAEICKICLREYDFLVDFEKR